MTDNHEERDLIAYCGLCCGDCFSHEGMVADLARDLRNELRRAKFDRTAESLSNISFQGAWECDEFETCEKLDFLKSIHGDAHLKNLRKIKKQGIDKFLEGKKHWYSKIK